MHKICEKGKKTMPALLNKVTLNSVSDKPPLYWTNSRKDTVSQFVQMTRCIPKPLRNYAYMQPSLILIFLSFDIVTVPIHKIMNSLSIAFKMMHNIIYRRPLIEHTNSLVCLIFLKTCHPLMQAYCNNKLTFYYQYSAANFFLLV